MIKFFTCLCGVLGVVLFAYSAYPAQALLLSPPVLDFDGVKGKASTRSVHLKNDTSEPIMVAPKIYGVSSQNEYGFPELEFLSDDSQLKRWISVSIDSPLTLAPQEEKDVPINVTVPEQTTAGGYYEIVSWETKGESGAIGLSPSPGVNIAISVPGEVTRKASLTQFSVEPQGGFGLSLPIVFLVKVKNDGGVHFYPEGSVEIRNFFGSVVARAPIQAQKNSQPILATQKHPNGSVLPGATRVLYATWGNGFAFGYYRATVTLDAQEAGVFTDQESFFATSPFAPYVLYALASLCLVLLLRSLLVIISVIRINK
ncbi:MAG: hypothetical protein Q8P56_02360 [Candidatus Uhrbacteria bacterium]|nr:hypothetical protein [Candidatus Uhrbacteria bacterium]